MRRRRRRIEERDQLTLHDTRIDGQRVYRANKRPAAERERERERREHVYVRRGEMDTRGGDWYYGGPQI